MSDIHKTYTLGNKTLEIVRDEDPTSPRTWDNLGTMACSHRRYNLGDPKKTKEIIGTTEAHAMQNWILKKQKSKQIIVKPIYMYDHSGITISTKPFSCHWDSGLVGWIFVPVKTAKEELGIKRMTAKQWKRVESYLEGEVETYDQFLTGDVYGFRIKEDGEETDSCWGFFGDNVRENGILDHINDEWKALFPEPKKDEVKIPT